MSNIQKEHQVNPLIINLPPLSNPNKEEYVISEICNALRKKGLIVLNFGEQFLYNSTIISLVLINRERIVVVSNNSRFKTIINILRINNLIYIVDDMKDVKDKLAELDKEVDK